MATLIKLNLTGDGWFDFDSGCRQAPYDRFHVPIGRQDRVLRFGSQAALCGERSLIMNNLVPPRDPNNDEDEDEHEWQNEPAVIREPDE